MEENSGLQKSYIQIEATYPHKLLLCMKRLLRGKKAPLQEESVFLDAFQKKFPDCESELALLKLAYEQNIIDNFFEADHKEEWRKKVAIQKGMRVLVKIVPECCAVMVVESLMFVFHWSLAFSIKRSWTAKEEERACFHDRIKIEPRNQMEILERLHISDNREIPERYHYTGDVFEEDDDLELLLQKLDKEDYTSEVIYPVKTEEEGSGEPEEQRPIVIVREKTQSVLEQKPEQVKFYKMMSISCQKMLKRALRGDTYSQCEMGDFYSDASSEHLDYKEAIRWYEVAAEKGYERAYFEIGKIYDTDGAKIPNGKKEALKIYEKLATQGYPTAQCVLGMKYRFGDGLEENFKMAETWLRKAAMQRHTAAIRNLADLYMQVGDTKNAQKWYHIGAANGDEYCAKRYKGRKN